MLKNEKGITLLELMVAMVITALLGMAIYNVCKMAMDAWQKGEARTQVYQNLRIATNRMSEEIRSAITLNSTYNPAPKDIYFYGTATQLDFISIAHPPIGNYYDSNFTTNELVFDCCEIGYSLHASEKTLYRRKQEKNVPDSDIKAGGLEKEMATHITSLSLTYYSADGSSKTSWNADPAVDGGLPKKVAINITAESESTRYPNTKTFSTWVCLSGR